MRAALLCLLLPLGCLAQDAQPLAGTAPLIDTGDFSARMVAGIGRWLERETALGAAVRQRRWLEAAAGADWRTFQAARREELRRIIGAVDPRTPGEFELQCEVGDTPLKVAGARFAERVRWPAFGNVHGEGVLLRPESARAVAIVLPDADELPEHSRLAQQLVAQGCVVLVMTLVDRRDTFSGNAALGRFTNQPHREWIQRPAFELGRTIIGYEVEKVLAAIDTLRSAESKLQAAGLSIMVAGDGEGGLVAMNCAALDERIGVTFVSGYFGPHEKLYAEPIYRNLFGFSRDFGDAELAALTAPRALIIKASVAPDVKGPPPVSAGHTGAAPGAVTTSASAFVMAEWVRALELSGAIKGSQSENLVWLDEMPRDDDASEASSYLLQRSGFDTRDVSVPAENITITPRCAQDRQRRAVTELEGYTQKLLRDAERARTAAVGAKIKPGAEWDAAQRELRERLAKDSIGRIDTKRLPANPRSRLIRETPTWQGYEVVLDVLPDVFAWGWLLVPRDLQPGERRPVVVCQHGLEGLPEDVVTTDEKTRAFAYYKGFASRLADQGFVVFAPHNPYRGKDEFRMLQRRANPLGLSLFSFIVAQHEVLTDWLAGQPFVDPERIAFYGLSYGGKSAMRLPALIPRYCLSICSGDFNEWIYKVTGTDLRMTYMFSGEWEMPEWNLGWVANYAEMAMLIAPRPFMVERGHDDGVATDEWVGYEYAKVKRGYDKLGIGDRTEIEWFDGPHTIHGVATFDFLHRHLRWPAK